MRCQSCGATGDPDAVFCVGCGRPLISEERGTAGRKPRIVIGAIVLVIAVIGAAAAGYYKFFLPDGVAAVVNGEVIRISELEAELTRTGNGRQEGGSARPGNDGANRGSARYQVLNRLITERIAVQEARAAGIAVTETELAAALAHIRDATGGNENAFGNMIADQYGSMRAFEQRLKRDLLVRKFLRERVAPAGADDEAARAAVGGWLRNASKKAVVRIAMAEQWSAGGCGCCAGGAPAGSGGKAGDGAAGSRTEKGRAAADAALAFWKERYGSGPFTARTTDFGCHIQVDIVRGGTVVGSLRYQDGTLTSFPYNSKERTHEDLRQMRR